MTDVLMPQLSDQMEEGTIIAWLIPDGQPVTAGDDLCEIETDKATVTCEAEADGVLEIIVAVGASAAVGEVIAHVGDERSASAAAVPAAEPTPADSQAAAPTPATRIEPASASSHGNGVLATPLAKRVAAVHDVDLAKIEGSGPRGRITKADVVAAAGLAPANDAPPEPQRHSTRHAVTATRLQQTVARRMTEAAAVPLFQVATEVVMDEAVVLRAKLKAATGEGPAPSVNDLIVKACALTLRDHPLVNGSYHDDRYELHDDVHVGIAVAADAGLLVVTVREADRRSVAQIAVESRRLAEAARAGTASAADLSGATFTVSNLGMYGMTHITALVNPPQASILGVGTIRDTLARTADGQISDRKLLTLTLSCDHRILNGADGARFLAEVRDLLENPYRLVI